MKRNSVLNRLLLKDRAVLRDMPWLAYSVPGRVNLNAWFNPDATHNNVGDYLSLVVMTHLCRENGIDPDRPVSKTKHLYAIGSILPGYQNATVWGSGFGYEPPRKWYSALYNAYHRSARRLDIRAVRGPETRRILLGMGIDCPEVYGDPGVLMPLIYPGTAKRGSRNYVVIPHYSRFSEFAEVDGVLSTFTRDYRSFIDKMLEAKLVISSSLHGIILAEAYGIPAVMLKDTPSADITKYKDWYASTGRTQFPIASSVEHALELGGTPLDHSIIERMQSDLLNSFPVDLWNE